MQCTRRRRVWPAETEYKIETKIDIYLRWWLSTFKYRIKTNRLDRLDRSNVPLRENC